MIVRLLSVYLSIHISNFHIAQIEMLNKLCTGKFTYIVIGPSQHGKTTFLTQIIGVEDGNIDVDKTQTGLGLVIGREIHCYN